MGLTAAASVQKLSTDAVIAMAPALTEPVTQSDISGQSPRPGDSITSSPTTITESIAAAENQPNNGKYPPTTVKPVNGVVKKQQQQLTDDLHTTTNGIEHMDQKISDNINNKYETIAAAATDQQNNDVTSTTRDDDGDQTLALVKVSDSQSSGMSMQNFTSKETAEVEQMLGDLAASGDIDLMSVFKTLESAPVSDAGFDLAGGLSLFNDVDVMNVYEETVPNTSPVKDPQISELRSDIEKRRQQMQRKCDFLLRRLRKLQARYMTQHASEEIVGLIEHCHRYNRRKEREIALGVKPPAPAEPNLPDVMPYQPPPGSSSSSAADAKLMPVSGSAIRHIIKKLEEKATNQKATYSKRQLGVKYFQSAQEASRQAVANNNASSPGVTRPPANTNNFSYVHRFEDKVIDQVDQVAGLLHAELRMVERAIDSDATASSSGGESADEMVVYSNATQQNLQISKRAAWRWARDRSSVASRWTWLLAQISDLEYRIRQHNELYQQIKRTKGSVQLEGEPDSEPEVESVNGYRGVLPGGSKPVETEAETLGNATSARTRTFIRGTFRKRKLLQTSNLHTISKKAAKSSTIKCGCYWPMHPCALCTGRSDPTGPRDLPDTMPESERIALVDPGFHPVLSFPDDATQGVHLEAIMRVPEWQNRVSRYTQKQASKAAERAANPAKFAAEGEQRQKRSTLKKMFGQLATTTTTTTGKYKKKFGILRGKYRKKQKPGQPNNNNNNRVKLQQMFKNAKMQKQRKSSQSADGGFYNKKSLHLNKAGLGYNDGESGGSGNNSGRSKNASPTLGTERKGERTSDIRRSRTSYDIDNIIIPYSVAAQTRVEVLPYKEIPTPKWNIIEDEDDDLLPFTSQELLNNKDMLEEDISDEALSQLHERALLEERKKFAAVMKYPPGNRPRANRRTDSHADSSGTNTPINPTSPGPATESGPPTPATPLEMQDPDNSQTINALHHTVNALTGKRERRRTSSMKLKESSSAVDTRSNTPELKEMIPPYDARLFPLPDHLFEEMLAEMPRGHKCIFDSLVLPDTDPDLLVEEPEEATDAKSGTKQRRTTNNNSISYQDEEHLEEMDDDDSDRNSIVERLLLLEKAYDEEKMNNQDFSAAETESVDSDEIPEEDVEDPNDPEWFEPLAKF